MKLSFFHRLPPFQGQRQQLVAQQAKVSSMKKVLKKSIALGGDSMSDYRNINGEKGKFQLYHRAYRRTGEKCEKNDGGVIIRKKLGGRSAHFCPVHQKLFRNPPERVIRAG